LSQSRHRNENDTHHPLLPLRTVNGSDDRVAGSVRAVDRDVERADGTRSSGARAVLADRTVRVGDVDRVGRDVKRGAVCVRGDRRACAVRVHEEVRVAE
jgi:transposase